MNSYQMIPTYFQGKHKVLQSWIYLSIITEVVLQLLVWISEYHSHILTTPPESDDMSLTALALRLTYAALIRIFVRTCLLLSVINFLRQNGSPSPIGNEGGVGVVNSESVATTSPTPVNPQENGSSNFLSAFPGTSSQIQLPPQILSLLRVPHDVLLLPVGSGPLNILRFYYRDIARLTKLLLTIDFVRKWCHKVVNRYLCKLLIVSILIAVGPNSTPGTGRESNFIWTRKHGCISIKQCLNPSFCGGKNHSSGPIGI